MFQPRSARSIAQVAPNPVAEPVTIATLLDFAMSLLPSIGCDVIGHPPAVVLTGDVGSSERPRRHHESAATIGHGERMSCGWSRSSLSSNPLNLGKPALVVRQKAIEERPGDLPIR